MQAPGAPDVDVRRRIPATLQTVEWQNSTLIEGDVAEEVARLKERSGNDIAVLGSGNLVQTLIENDLADEYALTVYPVLLGGGKRLFRDADQGRR
ncbi:MAG: dihydrofolate reductase family protein [Actinomycetota bacterium]